MKKLRFGMIAGLLPLAAALGAASARADDSDRRFYVAPMASATYGDKHRGADYGYGGALAVGKRITRGLELELLGTFTDYKVKKSDFPASQGSQPGNARLYGIGGGFNAYLAPSSELLKNLYLHADVQRGQGRSAPGTIRDYSTTLFDAGLGYYFELTKEPLGPFAEGLALRIEALYRLDEHSRGELGVFNGKEHKYFQEPVLNIGLRIPLGGRTPPATTPPPEAPPEVVPPEPAAEPAPPSAPPPCELPEPGQPISLEGCKLGDKLVLRGVNFEFNKASLTVNAKTILDGVAEALNARKDIKVEIDGHTDGKGADAYNQKLSERRADAVKQYLAGKGIDAGRMSTKGFGKTMPVADNSTDEGREQNRRVELKVLETNGPAGPGEEVPTSGAMDTTPPPAPAAAPAEAAPPEESSGTSATPPPADSGDSGAAAPEAAPAETAPDSTSGSASDGSASDSTSESSPAESTPAESAPASAAENQGDSAEGGARPQ